MKFANVILPLSLNAQFTYTVPEDISDKLQIGSRVIVPFNKSKFYTAIVTGFPRQAPEGVELKEIAMLLDARPIVRHPQLKLWEWISDYYLCETGDVYRAAVPAALKIESETSVMLSPELDRELLNGLSETQLRIVAILEHESPMSLTGIEKTMERSNLTADVNTLMERGVVMVTEKLVERYHARKVKFVSLLKTPEEGFAIIKGAKKRESLLLAWLKLAGKSHTAVEHKQLLETAGATSQILSAMVTAGIFSVETREINRFDFNGLPTHILPKLSEAQTTALDQIHKSWLDHDVTLLHGVTSSGKTEIYIHLIDYVLRQGSRAFFLVPEIALTTQLTRRLQDVFGERVLIYHSKFSDSERVDIWKKLLDSSEPCVVIGARSAVFLPFGQLKLVIVDEEHESSYKQADPAPRYNGRDVAIVLAKMHGAKTLLGSATPSIETRYKAESGKFGLVELMTRYGGAKMPKVDVVNLITARNNKEYLSPFALSTVRLANEALQRNEQVIFFQNRRGFAPIARCTACAWTPKCEYCDVTMTYHRSNGQLVCHYCGAMRPLPKTCPQCNEPKIEIYGYGTERVEDAVAERFNGYKVMRMDLDTTRNRDGHEKIISDFSNHKGDILVGTQMVTKGLDFENVSVVGILNADTMINIPDFRSAERAFNMLQQVAGRAGRREGHEGRVVIQTTQPGHPVIMFAAKGDYAGYYKYELNERRRNYYPPFTRVINIYLKHRDAVILRHVADDYARMLRSMLGNRVFGPEEPHVSRIQSLYIRKIMLKIEADASMPKVKEILRKLRVDLSVSNSDFRRCVIYYDVDPM